MAQENENIQNQSTGPNLFSRLRKWAVRLSIVGLLATNLATLVNATVYDFLYSAIESASQLFGADEFMSSSSTSDSKRKLSAEKKKLKAAKYSLSSSQNELRNSRQKLTAKKNELKNISDKFNEVSKGIKTRLGKSVLLNIEVIPASIAPFISTAAVLGALSGEVFLACETEKELNSLRALVGLKRTKHLSAAWKFQQLQI